MSKYIEQIAALIITAVMLLGLAKITDINSSAIEILKYDKRVEHLDKKEFEMYKYQNDKYVIDADGKVYRMMHIGKIGGD